MLNNVIRKRRKILCDLDDVNKILDILSDHQLTWQPLADLKIGCCRWANAPKCWFIYISATNKKWDSVLNDIKNKNITLFDESVGS